jgi:hypothetical protein
LQLDTGAGAQSGNAGLHVHPGLFEHPLTTITAITKPKPISNFFITIPLFKINLVYHTI